MDAKEWLGKNNQIGIDIFEKKYRHGNETVEEFADRVSGGDKELAQLILDKKFLFGGRVLANRGIEGGGNYYNCYSDGYVPDSMNGILDTTKTLGITYKSQGGQGISLSKIRPAGTPVGEHYESDGIVPFMRLFNEVTNTVSQGGARKGALMMSLDIRHKEADKFITIKSQDGEIEKANLSLEIDDEFMEAVAEYYETGKRVVFHEKREYSGHTIEYDIVPIDLYKLMMKTVYDWGEPGCIFTNRFRNYNLMEFDDEYNVETCNPSLRAGTLVYTEEDGVVPIESLEGKSFHIYNGHHFKPAECFLSGHNQPLYEIVLENGATYYATKEHKWEIYSTPYDNSIESIERRHKVTTAELKAGDLLPVSNTEMEHPRMAEWFEEYGITSYDIENTSRIAYGFCLPDETLADIIRQDLGWAGIVHTITQNDEGVYYIRIKPEFSSKFIDRFLTNIKPDERFEDCILSKRYECTLANSSIEVKSVNLTDLKEDVWDIRVYDDDHVFALQHCITGNCGEQPLKAKTSCNLGSLNLYEFIDHKFELGAKFNWSEFEQAIKIAIRGLDDIIDENLDRIPLEEYRQNSINYRNIGLGVMGYADMLMALGYTYGQHEAKQFTNDLFRFMFQVAVRTSNQLAKEKGAFPKWNDKVLESNIIKKHFYSAQIKEFEEDGLRNCSLLSIAPTGSIATMLGISGGIEPEFALSYTRRTDNLGESYDVDAKVVQDYKDSLGLNLYGKELPHYFVTSDMIEWHNRLETQAIIQNHIDTAISSTVNLPKETTLEEIERLYLEAWKMKLKGVTIFRDGCKRLGILLTEDSKTDNDTNEKNITTNADKITSDKLERGTIIMVNDDVIGKKRRLRVGCGSLHTTAFFDPVEGNLLELYLSKGSLGGCGNYMTGLSRMVSLAARGGISIEDIIDQLNSCGACPSYAVRTAKYHDTSKGACCPAAIGYALKDMYDEIQEELGMIENSQVEKTEEVSILPVEPRTDQYVKCPECGEPLLFEGGCNICKSCGYSSCS